MAAVKGTGRIGNIHYHIEVDEIEDLYAKAFQISLNGYLERTDAGKVALRINNECQPIRHLLNRAVAKYKTIKRSKWSVWYYYRIYCIDGRYRPNECIVDNCDDEASGMLHAIFHCKNTMGCKLLAVATFAPNTVSELAIT